MINAQIAILHEKNNLARLGRLLSLIGFSAEFFSKPKALVALFEKTPPSLVIIDRSLADNEAWDDALCKLTKKVSPCFRTLLVEEDEEGYLFADNVHKTVFNLFDLYKYLLQHLQNFSRKNLRVEIKLPSAVLLKGISHLTQISSLSTGGAFIRTGYPTPQKGEVIEMTLPLMGHRTEIEISGRVVYSVLPSLENNYIQGIGVCFDQLNDSSIEKIKKFLYSYIMNDISIEVERERIQRPTYLEPTLKKSLPKRSYIESLSSKNIASGQIRNEFQH